MLRKATVGCEGGKGGGCGVLVTKGTALRESPDVHM